MDSYEKYKISAGFSHLSLGYKSIILNMFSLKSQVIIKSQKIGVAFQFSLNVGRLVFGHFYRYYVGR